MNNFPFCIEFDFSSDSIHLLLFFSVFWWWFSGLWRWSSGVTWPISKWRTKLVHIGGSRGTSTEYENEESYPSTVGIWFTVMELLSLCTIRNTSIQIFKTTSIEPPPPPEGAAEKIQSSNITTSTVNWHHSVLQILTAKYGTHKHTRCDANDYVTFQANKEVQC